MAFVNCKYSGKPFQVLVGLRPFHQSVKFGQIQTGNKWTNGLFVESLAGIQPETAQFTVANNNFSGGRVEIVLGDFTIISGVDFYVGATAILTAANIATAITNLTGYTATNSGTATVNITFDIGSANKIDFQVNHYGTVTNITGVSPSDQMALGYPSPGAVDIN